MKKLHRQKNIFAERIEEVLLSGKRVAFMITGSEYEPPFPVPSTTGKHDYKKCEACQNYHRQIIEKITPKFKEFPSCRTEYMKLLGLNGFNKKDFGNSPQLIADKIIFSYQHIINNIEKKDWFQEITDYLDWIIESFGRMPKGYGPPFCLIEYYEHIISLICEDENLPKDKIERIKEYLITYYDRPKNGIYGFKALINTYQKWLDTFPFEISYFTDLKEGFKNHLPVFTGLSTINRFSGTPTVKTHTQSSFVDHLGKVTKQLLARINAPDLIKKGDIPDFNRHKLELANESLRVDSNKLTKDYSKGELKYVKVLSKWLELHKKYFEEITPLWNKPPNSKPTRLEGLKVELAKFGFFELDKVKVLKEGKQAQLIEIICKESAPYQIAMFDFLHFIQYLQNQYSGTKTKMFKDVASILQISPRAVKGNISVLGEKSQENRDRYTSFQSREKVKKDYQQLK